MRSYFALLALVLVSHAASAQPSLDGFALRPPCEAAPHPAYAQPGRPPAIATWTRNDLEKAAWTLAPCLHWNDGRTRMASALAAVVHAPSLDALLVRYGALSNYKTIRFWSTSQQAWEDFVTQAGFTDGPQANFTYPDLKAGDFATGRQFYYYEIGSTGRTVHHLTVRQRTADRVEVTTENVTPVRFAMFTLFAPRALRTATFIERRGPQEWGYYQTIGVGEGADFIAVHSASPYINRLIALYRYMAGQKTDGAPPAARN